MCGISGLVTWNASPGEAQIERVRQMNALQRYRGPDDAGERAVGSAVLGAVRLAILDLSPAGHMPMVDASGRFTIAYNGEVYNYRALRDELERAGRDFRSDTDTEVVLEAFAEWGPAALERLTGMFAFAIHDAQRDEVTLVRDRYGIKPLYYRETSAGLTFASEIKAVLPDVAERAVDAHSLCEWMFYQNVDAPRRETLFAGVRALLPGELLVARRGAVERRSWYSPPARVRASEFERLARAPRAEVIDELATCIESAVIDRLVSDVPVGTLLSGGLDSSLISALSARNRPGVKAFHVSIEGGGYDELPHARAAADYLDIELVTCRLDGAGFRRALPSAILHSDLPLTHANSVAYAAVSRVAREHGVVVLQSGEGADELFGGYAWRYRRHRQAQRLRAWSRRLPKRLVLALQLAAYASADLPVTSHRFDELLPEAIGFVDGYARRAWAHECEAAYAFVGNELDRSTLGVMLSDLRDFLTPLLRRLDRMSMASSVECRVPFLDQRVVELAANLPLEYRLGKRSDKWIVKRVAERHLPRELVERRKMGFPIPLGEWVRPLARAELFEGGFCEQVLALDRQGLRATLRDAQAAPVALLGLVSLELWGRLYLREEPVGSLEELVAGLEQSAG